MTTLTITDYDNSKKVGNVIDSACQPVGCCLRGRGW